MKESNEKGSRLNHDWFLNHGEEWIIIDPFRPETYPARIASIIAEYFKDIKQKEAEFVYGEHWWPAKKASEKFRLDGKPYMIIPGPLDEGFFEYLMLNKDGMEQHLADAGCQDCYCTAELD